MENKLMIAVTSPRHNIPEVLKQYTTWGHDIRLFKFYPEYQVYQEIKKLFLAHPEYTHLAITSDDLVVTREDIDHLWAIIDEKDFAIFTGVCNVDETDDDILNITKPGDMPDPATPYAERVYNFLKWSDLNDVHPIMATGFNGMAFMILRRDMVNMLEFRTDAMALKHPEDKGQSTDLMLSIECQEKGLPIRAETSIKMKHLRHAGKSRVGQVRPEIEFIPAS